MAAKGLPSTIMVAVIVTVPAVMPVTAPFRSTVATAGLLDDHETSAEEPTGVSEAVSLIVLNSATVS